jgi:hypothetical protein
MDFGLMTGFIAQHDTVYRYTLQFTTTHVHTCACMHARTHKPPQSCLHWSCSVAASIGGRSLSSAFPKGPHPQLQASNSNSSWWLNCSNSLTSCYIYLVLFIASWHKLHRKHHFPQLLCCCSCFCWVTTQSLLNQCLSMADVCRAIP